MTRYILNEFYREINIGQEFSFGYKNREFILSQTSSKIFIVEIGRENKTLEFNNPKDIAENFMLDGRKFKDIINEIEF